MRKRLRIAPLVSGSAVSRPWWACHWAASASSCWVSGCMLAVIMTGLGLAHLVTGDPSAAAGWIFLGVALLAMAVLLTWVATSSRAAHRRLTRASLVAGPRYLLGPSRPWWWWSVQAAIAAVLVVALRPVFRTVSAALELGSLPRSGDPRFVNLLDVSPAARVVRMGLDQALWEEWVFRGPPLLCLALVLTLDWHQRRRVAAGLLVVGVSILATAAFAAIHIAGGSANVVTAAAIGVLQCVWALASRSVVGPMMFHLFWNATIALNYSP